MTIHTCIKTVVLDDKLPTIDITCTPPSIPTVGELMELLSKYPKDLHVICFNPEFKDEIQEPEDVKYIEVTPTNDMRIGEFTYTTNMKEDTTVPWIPDKHYKNWSERTMVYTEETIPVIQIRLGFTETNVRKAISNLCTELHNELRRKEALSL